MHVFSWLVRVLVLLAACAGAAPASLPAVAAQDAEATESLVFQLKYRGWLSAGSEVEFADAVWRTVRLSPDDYRETEIWITSKDYDILESVYPFRYRMRSWYDGDAVATHAFETLDQKRRKTKHRLYLLNRTVKGVAQVDLEEHPEAVDPGRLRAASLPDVPSRPDRPQLFDRLSVIQYLRGIDLQPGETRDLMVTPGKSMIRYAITAGDVSDFELADKTRVPAMKLAFARYKLNEAGEEERLGDPILAWVSTDARRTPLRIEIPHTLGDFVVELKNSPPESVNFDLLATRPPEDEDWFSAY